MSARGVLPAVTVAAIVLAGCAATREAGQPFPASARAKLVLDRTTTRDAEKLLGRPFTTRTDADGGERWAYEHTQVSALRAVPFGRRVTVKQTPYEQLVLTFRQGRLHECVYVVERYRTDGDLIVPDGSSREACGQPAAR